MVIRRIFLHSSVVLAVGALLSLLVAWTTVLADGRWLPERFLPSSTPHWPVARHFIGAEAGERWLVGCFGSRLGVTVLRIYVDPKAPNDPFHQALLARSEPATSLPSWSLATQPPPTDHPIGEMFIEYAAGYPFTSFRGYCKMDTSMMGRSVSYWAIPIERKSFFGHPTLLPFSPVFPGFVVNTLLWGVIGYVLGGGVLRLGRFVVLRRRIRRGRCGRCGYPLADGGVCPECGTAVFRKRPAAVRLQ